MPLYEYQCGKCAHRFEKIQKFSDPGPDACPACGGGPVARMPSSPAIQFKGTGWYITDYAKKTGTDAGKSGADKAEGGKSDGAKSDSGGTSDAGAKSDGGTKSDSGGKADTGGKSDRAAAPDKSSTPAPAPAKDTKSN